jgi:uncharacterized protein YndB with AHSA1/START domain
MYPDEPQLAISRVLDAPRELAFRAFTDRDHLATWWGPSGNTLPTLLHLQAATADVEA